MNWLNALELIYSISSQTTICTGRAYRRNQITFVVHEEIIQAAQDINADLWVRMAVQVSENLY